MSSVSRVRVVWMCEWRVVLSGRGGSVLGRNVSSVSRVRVAWMCEWRVVLSGRGGRESREF